MRTSAMLSRAQNTFHHNPRLRGPVSSVIKKLADIFFLSLLASLILEHYANYSFYYAINRIVSRTQYQRTGH